jgi:hypothetical protein
MLNNLTTFTLTSYIDKFGDGKSLKSFFRRYKYYSDKSPEYIHKIIRSYNDNVDYYSTVKIRFSHHKKLGNEFVESKFTIK